MMNTAAPPAQLWRIALGFAVIAAIYAGLNAAAFALYGAIYGTVAVSDLIASLGVATSARSTLVLLATFLPLVVAVATAHRLLHRRRGPGLTGPAGWMARDFATALAMTFGVLGLSVGIVLALTDPDPVPNLPVRLWLALLPVTLIALGVQTLAEELAFRGYLQRQLAARMGPSAPARAVWLGLPAIAFGLLHFDPGAAGDAAPYIVLAATVFGLIAGDLTARTGSLGAAWGMHLANNALAVAVIATTGTITGLARWTTPYHVSEIALTPGIAAMELGPLALLWLVLRRVLPDRAGRLHRRAGPPMPSPVSRGTR